MNDRFRIILAALLVIVGLLCVVYALVAWRQADNSVPPDPVITPLKDSPDDTDTDDADTDKAPVAEKDDEDAAAAPVVTSASRSPSEDPAQGPTNKAREGALILWLVVAFPMVFVVLVAALLVRRWARPKPMVRTGPSDTTDLWVEAGKRLKIP